MNPAGDAAAGPRVGLFGGAFDPPHHSHVALAHAALDQLALDMLHVLPTGQAWHKARAVTAAEHRLAMAKLAFADLPRVQVDARELHRSGPSYTIDTLHELQAEHPGARFFLVLGADQARALPTWRAWQEILQIATISIADRDDGTPESAPFDAINGASAHIQRLHLPPTPLSATDIRQRLALGQGIAHLVPAPVARYIDLHHLYRSA